MPLENTGSATVLEMAPLHDLKLTILDCKTFEHHDSQSRRYDTARYGPIPANEELWEIRQTEKQKCPDVWVEF